jgi:hypothetical protein
LIGSARLFEFLKDLEPVKASRGRRKGLRQQQTHHMNKLQSSGGKHQSLRTGTIAEATYIPIKEIYLH